MGCRITHWMILKYNKTASSIWCQSPSLVSMEPTQENSMAQIMKHWLPLQRWRKYGQAQGVRYPGRWKVCKRREADPCPHRIRKMSMWESCPTWVLEFRQGYPTWSVETQESWGGGLWRMTWSKELVVHGSTCCKVLAPKLKWEQLIGSQPSSER